MDNISFSLKSIQMHTSKITVPQSNFLYIPSIHSCHNQSHSHYLSINELLCGKVVNPDGTFDVWVKYKLHIVWRTHCSISTSVCGWGRGSVWGSDNEMIWFCSMVCPNILTQSMYLLMLYNHYNIMSWTCPVPSTDKMLEL